MAIRPLSTILSQVITDFEISWLAETNGSVVPGAQAQALQRSTRQHLQANDTGSMPRILIPPQPQEQKGRITQTPDAGAPPRRQQGPTPAKAATLPLGGQGLPPFARHSPPGAAPCQPGMQCIGANSLDKSGHEGLRAKHCIDGCQIQHVEIAPMTGWLTRSGG